MHNINTTKAWPCISRARELQSGRLVSWLCGRAGHRRLADKMGMMEARSTACFILLVAALMLQSPSTTSCSRDLASASSVLKLPQELLLVQDAPSAGYRGLYDLQIAGLHYRVQIYYYMIPGKNEFWFKSHGTSVDIPWCGPYQYHLEDAGGGNFDIVPEGIDPHCGEKEEKEHPVKNLKRVWNPAANTVTQTMEVYTIWPVGWKALEANCAVCAEPDCVCDNPGCSA